VLFSLHLKATMMKVSDPIIFGHAVGPSSPTCSRSTARPARAAGVNPNNGWATSSTRSRGLPPTSAAIEADIAAAYAERPGLAMVDSDKGITNLHVPSDVIVDASMPAMIRTSGQMWNKDGEQQDTKAVIPDAQLRRRLPGRHRRLQGARRLRPDDDGLGAQRRPHGPEGRGVRQPRQDLRDPGRRHRAVVDGRRRADARARGRGRATSGACARPRTPAHPDWVKLAVTRARATGAAGGVLARRARAHDAQLIAKVERYLPGPRHRRASTSRSCPASRRPGYSLERIRRGEDTISVTGNVLRDYLTDLFPILELGTSAKMLSIVPLMNGGGLFETGAGGSAPSTCSSS
jgi:isocitrate dehydrogenase